MDKIKAIKSVCKQNRIDLLFLFGSQAESGFKYLNGKEVTPDRLGDLDIGIYVERNKIEDTYKKLQYYGYILSELQEIIPVFEIDLILLNEVSVFILCEAFKGINLYEKSHTIYTDVLEYGVKMASDLYIPRKMYYDDVLKEIQYV